MFDCFQSDQVVFFGTISFYHNIPYLFVYGGNNGTNLLGRAEWNERTVLRLETKYVSQAPNHSLVAKLSVIDGDNRIITNFDRTMSLASMSPLEWMFRRTRNSANVYRVQDAEWFEEPSDSIESLIVPVQPIVQPNKYATARNAGLLNDYAPLLKLLPTSGTLVQPFVYSFQQSMGTSRSFMFLPAHSATVSQWPQSRTLAVTIRRDGNTHSQTVVASWPSSNETFTFMNDAATTYSIFDHFFDIELVQEST